MFVSGQVKLYERACHHIYILLAETKVIVNSNQLSGSTVSVVLIPWVEIRIKKDLQMVLLEKREECQRKKFF